ncbi:unnamed protein product [Pseudo-nitzschia multistriata]|uniref:Dephospho-CoA kinase n=1 Tax=Pseudo-nitzschia multistriata TaxID=183589 RepID=A0A448ZGU9_9STRA|nr:unnamed protein product [Pseudo-nitzschia multistriata]
MPSSTGVTRQRSFFLPLLLVLASCLSPALSLLSLPATTTIASCRTAMELAAAEPNTAPGEPPRGTAAPSFKVLGVCGGIGSGKSTACKLLVSSCGCLAHIDADKVAHSVYAPGSRAVEDVAARFGEGVLKNGGKGDVCEPREIDRKQLGAIVFADRSAMADLEKIVWPHVGAAIGDTIGKLREEWERSGGTADEPGGRLPVVVLEAAVLLDAGWEDLADGVWAVTVPREDALRRLIESRGLSEAEAAKRIDAQASCRGIGNVPEEVAAGAVTGVVANDGSLSDLERVLRESLEDPSFWKPAKEPC